MSNASITCPHCGCIAWRYAPATLAAYQALLGIDGPITTAGLVAELGCATNVAQNHLKRLVRTGLLRRAGRRPRVGVGGWEALYALTKHGALHPLTDAREAVQRGNCGPRPRMVA